MTEQTRFQVSNAAGRLIADVADRNMEAVAWGSVQIGSTNEVKRIDWPLVDAPMVFMKCVPSTYMYRSPVNPDANGDFGSSMYVSAAGAPTRIDYVVGGFRRADAFVGKEGLFMRDAKGRVGFDSGRRYLRLTNPPTKPFSINGHPFFDNEPTWRRWQAGAWSNGAVTVPGHPNWTPNTYFYWPYTISYPNDASNNWYLGFGVYESGNIVVVERFSANRSMNETYNICPFSESGSGGMQCHLNLTCEFVP